MSDMPETIWARSSGFVASTTNGQKGYLLGSWLGRRDALGAEYRRADLPRPEDAARIAELEAALAPFAALLANHHATMKDDHPVFGIDRNLITAGDLRRAALAADSGAADA